MLEGRCGAASKLAMSILVRMADVYGAEEMKDITQVHIDGVGLLSEAGLEFSETLASQGGKVVVPTTLNMVPVESGGSWFRAVGERRWQGSQRTGCWRLGSLEESRGGEK